MVAHRGPEGFNDVDRHEATAAPGGGLITHSTLLRKPGWHPGQRLLLEQSKRYGGDAWYFARLSRVLIDQEG